MDGEEWIGERGRRSVPSLSFGREWGVIRGDTRRAPRKSFVKS